MIGLIFNNFIRSNRVKAGLLFLLLTGIISLFVGKQFIEKQKLNVVDTGIYQKKFIEQNVKFHKSDLGLLLYYLKFSFINKTEPISGLSIGQRDINSQVKSVTIRGLEGQKYDTDLNNPHNLLFGNLDFSFVLIFLFPLIIIAFTFNIVSEEKEQGTWQIVLVQSKSPFRLILNQFGIRLMLLWVVLFLIILLAIPVLGIAPDYSYWTFTTVSISYTLVWFGICFWVVSLQKSSNSNAIILLSFWMFLTIILPALANNYLVNKYPVPEALKMTLEQRKGYHEKWDMPKASTMSNFFAHYPQYNKYPFPEVKFSWLWYYAMQQMGDDESLESSKEMKRKVLLRQKASEVVSLAIPSMHTQLILNKLAKTDLNNHIQFLNRLDTFHENLRLYFYPKIFEGFQVEKEDWSKFTPKYTTIGHTIDWSKSLLPLLLVFLLFTITGLFNLTRSLN